MKPLMNIDEAHFDDVEENGLYTSSRATLSDQIGARQLGYGEPLRLRKMVRAENTVDYYDREATEGPK